MIRLKMKSLSLFFMLILALNPANIFSQVKEIQVSGMVTELNSGNPLPGVNVMNTGKVGEGTITDINGKYTIMVQEGAKLTFSYIGYVIEEVIANRTSIDIALAEEIKQLDELVIVGTAMKKSDLTGSVARVTSEKLKEVPTSSVVQALQGKVAGLYIQSNPSPGSKASIKIRGNNSIQYGTNPIFVIDGMVTDDSFDMLAIEDIATIDVLKDASATAIYGARGANGVVVVTTKKGKKGEQRVTYDTWVGYKEFSNEMPLLNGQQIYDLRVDAYANAYMDKNPTADRQRYIDRSLTNTNPIKNLIFSKEELESYTNGDSYNWLNEITRKGVEKNHAISFSGGDDNGSYFISFNYNNQVGQIKNSGYKRYSGKVNLEQKINNWLKIGTNNTLVNTLEHPVANGNMFITSLRANPLLPVSFDYWYMKEGKIDNQSANNPLRDLTVTMDVNNNRLLSSNYLNINPIKGLNIRSTYSMDLHGSENYTYYPTTSTQSYKSTLNGQSVQVKGKGFNWQWDNSISYNKIFAEKNMISALLGSNMSLYSYSYNQQNASGYNNDLFTYKNPQGATDFEKFYLSSDFWTYTMKSYLMRLNYSYDSRYYITLTGRKDGSSKFGSENKWGFFPSIATSWNISNESFMQNQELINNLRLRMGYGIAGNQNIPNYGFHTVYTPWTSLGTNILINGGRYGNPGLRWEKQKQLNIGLDVGLWNDRLSMVLDLFHINNEDLLMERSTAPSLGFLTKIDNVGALENKGAEFSFNLKAIDKKDLSWDIAFNIAADRNKITRLYEDVTEIYNLGGYSNNEIQREGNLFLNKPLNTIYVYKFDRIVQEEDMDYVNSLEMGSRIVKPGDILPFDKDHNNIINDLDRDVVGKRDPDFYGGLASNFAFRGFAFDIFANYSIGADRVSYLYETLIGSTGNSSAHKDLLNRWTSTNTNTNIPRAYSDGGRYSLSEVDWAVQDASFFRISEITLSYTIPARLMNSLYIKKLRVYLTGNNLLTFTNYKGYDPESGDWYPSSKMYVAGINVSF